MDDDGLFARARELQAEGADVLRALRFEEAFAGFGGVEVVGSMVSGLMVWRDLDVMFTAPAVGQPDVFAALGRLARVAGLTVLDYRDERGDRRPTPKIQDERHYAVCRYDAGRGPWKVDITVWIHEVERPHRAEALRLGRESSAEERAAILRLKDLWHRGAHYPYEVGGTDVYTAVIDHGVRTPGEFSAYLRERGLPADPPTL